MVQKLLAALDGTKSSESILPFLEGLLGSQDADVTLARVVPGPEGGKLRQATEYLNRLALKLDQKGAVVDVRVAVGKPAPALVDLAVRGGYSMILMCSNGKKGLKRMLLGSVTEEVLRTSPLPVLIVHPQTGAAEPPRIRRIVVPLDGSLRSGSILPHVTALAKATGAKVLFMTTVDPRSHDSYPVDVLAKNLFREQKEMHRHGVTTELSIRYGDPTAEILSFGDVQSADLLALSTHGRSGLERVRYGSVAESVLREGKLPMLVLRTAGKFVGDPIHAPAIRAEREKKRAEAVKEGAGT
jgi:nucleotide-binding universal stress UspA family protein